MIRDLLLGVYALAWLVVVLITAWRTGTVPAELWAVLGVGAGALIAVFRTDDYVGRRRRKGKDQVEDNGDA
jgi:hypothetical protein